MLSIDLLQVFTILAMGVSVSRVDFKTLIDQIYKFEEKWVSFSINYVINRFTASIYYSNDGCKHIASRFTASIYYYSDGCKHIAILKRWQIRFINLRKNEFYLVSLIMLSIDLLQVFTILAMGVSVSRIDFKTLIDQIYKFEEKWVSFSVNYLSLIDLLQVFTILTMGVSISRVDLLQVFTIIAMDISISRIDFKTLTDQIYKFEEKWLSFNINYVIDRFTASIYYYSNGYKRITSRF